MGSLLISDLGDFVTNAFVSAKNILADDGTTDNVEVTGATVDRHVNGKGLAQSGVVAVAYTTTLHEAETATVRVQAQESDDDSTWTTATTPYAATVVATGTAGGSTHTGVVEVNADYRGSKRYVRYNVLVDLSEINVTEDLLAEPPVAGVVASDVAVWGATVTLGGFAVSGV